MDALVTKEELRCTSLLSHNPALSSVEATRFAAAAARDEALAARLRGAMTSVMEAVMAWPRKRRVIAQLAALSDRELADIGLTRGDFTHVFEVEARAANDLVQTSRVA